MWPIANFKNEMRLAVVTSGVRSGRQTLVVEKLKL